MQPTPIPGDLYAASNGSATNPGTADAPQDLQTALSRAAGLTVWAQAGTYRGAFEVPNGVTLRPMPGANVVVDGSLIIVGGAVYDLEITNSSPDRRVPAPGVSLRTSHSVLIGCVIHDTHTSGVEWYYSGTGEVSENIVYNNGYLEGNGTGHGHAIYSHNHAGGARLIENNILFNAVGGYLLHVYSATINELRDYTIRSNITFGRPNLIGGEAPVYNLRFEDNSIYQASVIPTSMGHRGGSNMNQDAVIEGNTFTGMAYLDVVCFDQITLQHNRFLVRHDQPVVRVRVPAQNSPYFWDLNEYRVVGSAAEQSERFGVGKVAFSDMDDRYTFSEWQRITGFDTNSVYQQDSAQIVLPPVDVQIYPCTKSTRKLAHIAVYNRDRADSVALDLSSLNLTVGRYYRLAQAQNLAERHSFQYDGNPVSVPMIGWTLAIPQGIDTTRTAFSLQNLSLIEIWPSITFPEFGAFVLEEAGS